MSSEETQKTEGDAPAAVEEPAAVAHAEEPAATPASDLAEAAPVEEPAAPAEPVEEPIAPGVERLDPPHFAAKKIPDQGRGPPAAFLAAVSIISLVSDIGTKLWAESHLNPYKGGAPMEIFKDRVTLMYAENKGGAWGLLQATREDVRRPFFLLVSVAAIAFIVTLYRRLTPRQRALKWGLPLVLGGALGNVFDRIRYGFVVDFIDVQSEWIRRGNELIAKYNAQHQVTNHWPTFNVADIAICVGVALMAVDMFTSKRGPRKRALVADDLAAGVDAEVLAAKADAPIVDPIPEPEAPPADPPTATAHE